MLPGLKSTAQWKLANLNMVQRLPAKRSGEPPRYQRTVRHQQEATVEIEGCQNEGTGPVIGLWDTVHEVVATQIVNITCEK